MPYHEMEGIYFGAEPIFAASPNWVQTNPGEEGAEPAMS
jgi:hypothetical protein